MRLDERELTRWGASIGAAVRPPVVIGLVGRLGAGKSVLARAIGAGAGVTDAMPSPSYTLVHHYEGDRGCRVAHLDLYRTGSPDELDELGWSELASGDEIVLIEWPERAGERMPPDHWLIRLEVPPDQPQLRDVEVRRVGFPPALGPFPMSVSP